MFAPLLIIPQVMSAITRLLDLPPELLTDILNRLDRPDQKAFRTVSHFCDDFISAIVFQDVFFDLEPNGCNGLCRIAHSPKLSRHVRTLELKRRGGLRDFEKFEEFQSSVIYEYAATHGEPLVAHAAKPLHTLTEDSWNALSELDRRQLSAQYSEDKHALAEYNSRLAREVFFSIASSESGTDQYWRNKTNAQQTLREFTGAVNALTGVTALRYTAAYEEEDWGRIWRNLEFDVDGLGEYRPSADDPVIDALQLFVSLRAVLLAPNAVVSATLNNECHAFWSLTHRLRVLDWKGEYAPLPEPEVDSTDEDLEHAEIMTRDMVKGERRFARLTKLDFDLDLGDSPEERETVAIAVSRILKEAVRLEHLVLIIDRQSSFNRHFRPTGFFQWVFREPLPDFVNEILLQAVQVSKHILSTSAALRHSSRLYLSCSTTKSHLSAFLAGCDNLRHLEFNCVSLLPNGGSWKTMFEWTALNLRLDHLELENLDEISEGQQRLLLCPRALVWHTDVPDQQAYYEYKIAITQFALGTSSAWPPFVREEDVWLQSAMDTLARSTLQDN